MRPACRAPSLLGRPCTAISKSKGAASSNYSAHRGHPDSMYFVFGWRARTSLFIGVAGSFIVVARGRGRPRSDGDAIHQLFCRQVRVGLGSATDARVSCQLCIVLSFALPAGRGVCARVPIRAVQVARLRWASQEVCVRLSSWLSPFSRLEK